MPHRTNEIAEVDLQERRATEAGDPARFGDVEGRDERERGREREKESFVK